MSKPSYTTYIRHRVEGIEPDPRAAEKGRDIMIGRDLMAHPDFGATRRNFSASPFPGCVGPLKYKDRSALDRDLAHLKAAAAKSKPADVFMTAPSPGILTRFIINLHYPNEEAYVDALAEMMKTEYRAIVEAGFVLQIDCPDLGSCRNNQYRDLTDDEFRNKIAERNIAALNGAIEGLPADRMRLHICWGNYEGPHSFDLPLLKIIDIAFKARIQAFSIEAANPRHDHEWEELKTFKIPDDKILIPGVIDSTTNFVEHPKLVAQRIGRYADIVGRERVHRRRRLRLRHRGADRPDRRRQHRLGEAQGARRRRGDRKPAAVGLEGGVMRFCKGLLIAAVATSLLSPAAAFAATSRQAGPAHQDQGASQAPLARLWISSGLSAAAVNDLDRAGPRACASGSASGATSDWYTANVDYGWGRAGILSRPLQRRQLRPVLDLDADRHDADVRAIDI